MDCRDTIIIHDHPYGPLMYSESKEIVIMNCDFRGWITVNGRTWEFDSYEEHERVKAEIAANARLVICQAENRVARRPLSSMVDEPT